MIELLEFTAILQATAPTSNRYLLAGNGLSIGAAPAFATEALAASFRERLPTVRVTPHVMAHFDMLDGPVENRVTSLVRCPDCVLYEPNLREAMIEAILESSPGGHGELLAPLCAAVSFLARFVSIFTLSYDLLLYWLIMHPRQCPECSQSYRQQPFGDGFGKGSNRPDGYRMSGWTDSFPGTIRPVRYLHGAVHLVENEGATWKLVAQNNAGDSALSPNLRDLVRERRDKGLLPPLVVFETTAEDKKKRIQHNRYLCSSMRSFDSIDGHLIVYGTGLNDQDDHLWRSISVNGHIKSLNVGVYGDPNSAENRGLINRAYKIAAEHGSLTLRFYRSETASAWG